MIKYINLSLSNGTLAQGANNLSFVQYIRSSSQESASLTVSLLIYQPSGCSSGVKKVLLCHWDNIINLHIGIFLVRPTFFPLKTALKKTFFAVVKDFFCG